MRQPSAVWKDVYGIGGPDMTDPSDCCVYLIDAGELVVMDTGAALHRRIPGATEGTGLIRWKS